MHKHAYSNEANGHNFTHIQFGDGDGWELTSYQFLEGLLPFAMPQLYFGDISRESSYYMLITECVPYAPRGSTANGYMVDWRQFPVGQVLPKSGKYQDDRMIDSHLYYYALLKAMARMAAADKRGVFDGVFGPCPPATTIAKIAAPPDSKSRRRMMKDVCLQRIDDLTMFALDYAPKLFKLDRAFLERVKVTMHPVTSLAHIPK